MRRDLALLLAVLPSCSVFLTTPTPLQPAPDEVLDRQFTPQELAADVDDLFILIENVHPDPYTVLPRDEVLQRRAALVASLDRPLTRVEFQPLVAELVAALGDGHTSIYTPSEEWWKGPAHACFPIDVAWENGALYLRRTAVLTPGGELGPGARIVSIDGRPADELFRGFLAHVSGESEAFRVSEVEESFPVHLWLAGMEGPWTLRVAPVEGAEFGVGVSGMEWGVVPRGASGGVGQRWAAERRADGVVLLTIDTFASDPSDFEDFAEQVFEGLHAQPPRALVIDLRRNGGGDSRNGDELLQYLAHEPWRQSARKEWKMSDEYRDFLKSYLRGWIRWMPVQYLHPTGWQMWTADDGEILVMDEELVEPRDEELRFDGPVAFLIGPGTFSSAKSLAAAVKDYELALLVGEETGGQLNGFGEVYPFRLPRTQLAGQVSSARHVRPNGDASTLGGVQPDVVVHPVPGARGDVVLEAAIATLLPPGAP